VTGAPYAGIDGAERTGFAVVDPASTPPRLLLHGAARIRTGADVEKLVAEIASAGPALVGIEAPFVKPAARGGNPASALALAVLVGRFRQALDARSLVTRTVLASSWQPLVLGCGRWTSREARKAAAVAWARRTFGVELGEDAADAAAIAMWASRLVPSRPGKPEQGAQGSLFGTDGQSP